MYKFAVGFGALAGKEEVATRVLLFRFSLPSFWKNGVGIGTAVAASAAWIKFTNFFRHLFKV